MRRFRLIVGLLCSIFLIVSAGAHSILGWRQMNLALGNTNAPDELKMNLMIGWEFAGIAMLLLGYIVMWAFLRRLRQQVVSMWPSMLTGILYTIFGAWAMYLSQNNFFLIFLIPGVLLLLASWELTREPHE